MMGLQFNPRTRVHELEAERDRLRGVVEQMAHWRKAYDVAGFVEPDWPKVNQVLSDAGLSLGAISASNMRHVITQVSKIAEAGLRPVDDAGEE